MQTTTYRGVRLRVQKGSRFGYLRYTVAGEPWGEWMGRDEDAAIASMRGYVDMAGERPEAFEARWHPKKPA